MWIEFNQLSNHSRVWIFPIAGEANASQLDLFKHHLKDFINEWTSHNQDLKGSGAIIYDRFAVVGLDESYQGASGCSIDKLMRFIQIEEEELGIPLLLKSQIGIRKGEGIRFLNLGDIKHQIANGTLTREDEYFDLMIQEKGDLEAEWVKPLSEGWLGKRLFNN